MAASIVLRKHNSIDATHVGVSVTRAFHWPPDEPYTTEEAFDLLDDKMSDVLLSADNVVAADAWSRSILHIIAYNDDHADRIEEAYGTLPGELKIDTLVFLTVTDGEDEFLY